MTQFESQDVCWYVWHCQVEKTIPLPPVSSRVFHFICRALAEVKFHNDSRVCYFQWLLSIESREWFLKYQDCQWICCIKFSITKLKMLARHVDFIEWHRPNTLWYLIKCFPICIIYYYYLFISIFVDIHCCFIRINC